MPRTQSKPTTNGNGYVDPALLTRELISAIADPEERAVAEQVFIWRKIEQQKMWNRARDVVRSKAAAKAVEGRTLEEWAIQLKRFGLVPIRSASGWEDAPVGAARNGGSYDLVGRPMCFPVTNPGRFEGREDGLYYSTGGDVRNPDGALVARTGVVGGVYRVCSPVVPLRAATERQTALWAVKAGGKWSTVETAQIVRHVPDNSDGVMRADVLVVPTWSDTCAALKKAGVVFNPQKCVISGHSNVTGSRTETNEIGSPDLLRNYVDAMAVRDTAI